MKNHEIKTYFPRIAQKANALYGPGPFVLVAALLALTILGESFNPMQLFLLVVSVALFGVGLVLWYRRRPWDNFLKDLESFALDGVGLDLDVNGWLLSVHDFRQNPAFGQLDRQEQLAFSIHINAYVEKLGRLVDKERQFARYCEVIDVRCSQSGAPISGEEFSQMLGILREWDALQEDFQKGWEAWQKSK